MRRTTPYSSSNPPLEAIVLSLLEPDFSQDLSSSYFNPGSWTHLGPSWNYRNGSGELSGPLAGDVHETDKTLQLLKYSHEGHSS